MSSPYTLLCLGDSYTIGESVPLHESFPYQTVHLLRQQGIQFVAPEIIAKTGWTTGELQAAITGYPFAQKYDFVTLLIGVNNQYRGMEVIPYKEDFEHLLQKAIGLVNGKASRVVVLSIPDYSVTPFAREKDPERVAHEVDIFNATNRAVAAQYKVHYADITPGSREASGDPELVAADGLHPSAHEYKKWAQIVSAILAEGTK